MPNARSRTDRRTRDHLRRSNAKLREAIRKFLRIQDQLLREAYDDRMMALVPADWKKAYDELRRLSAAEPSGPGKTDNNLTGLGDT